MAFWEEEAGRIVLAAWVGAGPLLAAFMIVQRGFTRLLGLAHLIPWIPMIVYLELRLLGPAVGPRITWETAPSLFTWVLTLLAFTYVCLAFDVYDLLRWIRGDRLASDAYWSVRRCEPGADLSGGHRRRARWPDIAGRLCYSTSAESAQTTSKSTCEGTRTRCGSAH